MPTALLPPEVAQALSQGRHGEPFAWLGCHRRGELWIAATVAHDARQVSLCLDDAHAAPATEVAPGVHAVALRQRPARLVWQARRRGQQQRWVDPYQWPPQLPVELLKAFREGSLLQPATLLGAHLVNVDGVDGARFAVWAPEASRVSVVGDFNDWDGRRHPMRQRLEAGVWEIFLPGVAADAAYKYELLDRHGQLLPLKADPYARRMEPSPGSASLVSPEPVFRWHDAAWLARRAHASPEREPVSIYELHALSWRHGEDGQPLGWDRLGAELIPYVQAQGFTHIELLPISEFPYGGSWGYQPLGLYAPTARMGSPAAFARFVDSCHVAGIGVIVDWVGAHFPADAHGLQRFDGTALYEHADPREGVHPDWQTLIFNYGRAEVRSYLIGSALEWIDRYHVDGLRVDAVASMLYRDYSRAPGQWLANRHGGPENLEAIAFLRELNQAVAAHGRGLMMIAEDSTAWPGVTARTDEGGLGFGFTWDMGWMHDTLRYLQRDPVDRRHHHADLTLRATYGHTERFVLPLSHDEVVHGKGSLLSRMPGDRWQQFANLRALLALMWATPGKKLLFMGGEFGQWREWDHDRALDWALLDDPMHAGMQALVHDLNHCLQHQPALHRDDHDACGVTWVVADDAEHSMYAFLRHAEPAPPVLVVLNFTPIPRHGYTVGVPRGGRWRELLNTDSAHYGGSNIGNGGYAQAEATPTHVQPFSLPLTVPPLGALYLRAELPA
ncbi:1,4-alpha-glucan branching protein GlgB [Dyella sp.]|jgi:1,4-alpha-glucan branching enzyme|uniref:1,4-alpha-glucan branching protein GlgB n=1 Tax=Dyella sp. TaxID=1869338 RepID=UPI002D76BD78|nr:1,4-alpha-glucan branching protein GlgB [Dyella sp.]HET6433111.1 1,4-alpha-glucan branching protein GlgB [Dyella sp.]